MMLLPAVILATIFTQTPSAPLRIVVIEGEGAVNIVQQKTAVRPLVEVRDRNNVPVPGATVTFTLNGQPATFAGGAQTMTVTTNASGQAAASGFSAVREGAVQIQVQAAHQGQTAAAMISQTNFATMAAASAAGVAVGAAASGAASTAGGAAAAAGAAAGGGGISATTIAIVGAAVGGGAVAATTVAKGKDGESGSNFDGYRGSFSGPYVYTNTGAGGSVCVFNRNITGTMELDLRTDRSGGAVRLQFTISDVSASGTCILGAPVSFSVPDITASGGPSNLSFNSARTVAANSTDTWTFSGSFANNVVTGTLTFEQRQQTSTGGQTFSGIGNGSFSITLTR